jgi:hypothetical protein
MPCYFADMNVFRATLELESLKAENKVGAPPTTGSGRRERALFHTRFGAYTVYAMRVVALLPLLPAR